MSRLFSGTQGGRLATVSAADIGVYLDVIGRKRYMVHWKFRQLVDALRILFCELVKSPWAKGFDWHMWMDNSKDPPEDHVTIARTSSITNNNKTTHGSKKLRACRQKFSGMFERPLSITTIRVTCVSAMIFSK